MRKTIVYNISAAVVAMIALCSCKNFLDPQEYAMLTKDKAYSVSTYVANMPLAAYSAIPGPFNNIGGSNLSAASDEAEEVNGDEAIQRFNNGSWNQYINPDDEWASCYRGIRIACDYLEETKNLTWEDIRYSDSDNYKIRMKDLRIGRAEMRFIRAYLYLELIKRYGDVPLIVDKVDVTGKIDFNNYKRTPVEQIVEFIKKECDIVSSSGEYQLTQAEKDQMMAQNNGLLPLPYRDYLDLAYPLTGDDSKYLGRATAASAIALKAKSMIYFASPLFNPNNDVQRWKDAAKECKRVIDLPTTSYGLESKYQDIFNRKNNWSKEFLFVRKMTKFSSFDAANYPISIEGGKTGTCPSQNLVDSYEVLKEVSPGVYEAEPFDWNNAAHAANPYANRDPRLRMTVYVNGDTYSSVESNNIVLECWEGGNSAAPIRFATKTGYYLKKYINPDLELRKGSSDYKTWAHMRMGDFYLYYAEAMNEAYGPDSDPDGYGMTATAALNKIRDRSDVKMPPVVEPDKVKFKKHLVNERRVELAFECARYWDLRRWMHGQRLNENLMGVKVTKDESDQLTYSPFVVEKRVFDEAKMYLYPIPYYEINRAAGALTQNPNW